MNALKKKKILMVMGLIASIYSNESRSFDPKISTTSGGLGTVPKNVQGSNLEPNQEVLNWIKKEVPGGLNSSRKGDMNWGYDSSSCERRCFIHPNNLGYNSDVLANNSHWSIGGPPENTPCYKADPNGELLGPIPSQFKDGCIVASVPTAPPAGSPAATIPGNNKFGNLTLGVSKVTPVFKVPSLADPTPTPDLKATCTDPMKCKKTCAGAKGCVDAVITTIADPPPGPTGGTTPPAGGGSNFGVGTVPVGSTSTGVVAPGNIDAAAKADTFKSDTISDIVGEGGPVKSKALQVGY